MPNPNLNLTYIHTLSLNLVPVVVPPAHWCISQHVGGTMSSGTVSQRNNERAPT